MTDEQIIKALGYHRTTMENHCDECPYKGIMCSIALSSDALDLINRQKAEIERLKKDKYRLQKALNQSEDYRLIAKTEAIKEFAERVKQEINFPLAVWKVFDNLVKEMTEVSEKTV